MDKAEKKALAKQAFKHQEDSSKLLKELLEKANPVSMNHPDYAKYLKETRRKNRWWEERGGNRVYYWSELELDFFLWPQLLAVNGDFPLLSNCLLHCKICNQLVPTQHLGLKCKCGNIKIGMQKKCINDKKNIYVDQLYYDIVDKNEVTLNKLIARCIQKSSLQFWKKTTNENLLK